MAKKAYIRFDDKGKAVPSTLIWNEIKPKIGDWEEINGYKCCVNITSTTSTTSSTSSTSSTTSTSTTLAPVIVTTLYQSSCAPYNWVLGGQTIYGSGTFTHVDGQNVYVLVYINTNMTGIVDAIEETVTAPGSYFWPITGTTYIGSGDYPSDPYSCPGFSDTIWILHLTIT